MHARQSTQDAYLRNHLHILACAQYDNVVISRPNRIFNCHDSKTNHRYIYSL